jgi:probable selenium-dependent hydroxylase accessory protein YqeC
MREVLMRRVSNLVSALGMESRELVALVGGGGKTSLLFALAEELHRGKKRVVTSTTTKVRHGEAHRSPCIVFTGSVPSWKDKLSEGLQNHGHVFLARGPVDSGKVDGISPSLVNEMYQDGGIDYIIIEADGSSGRPVKVPADHEPVIPSSATKVVAMLGLEALGKKMGPEVVFRAALFGNLTGLEPGERLTPAVLASLFLEPEGLFKGTPSSAKKIVFLNKRDLLSESGEAEELAGLILGNELNQVEQVVIGSILERKYVVCSS